VSTSLKLMKVTRGPCGALRHYAHARLGVIETLTTWEEADGPDGSTVIRVERVAKRRALIKSIAKALKGSPITDSGAQQDRDRVPLRRTLGPGAAPKEVSRRQAGGARTRERRRRVLGK
jgi:hypothetical protein